MREELEGTKIAIYGSKESIKQARDVLAKRRRFLSGDEYRDRLFLQRFVLPEIKATILYAGNTVWSKEKLIRDFKRILKNGISSLTDYLYEFFHLECGTIAHYNKQGWIDNYPDLYAIKQLIIGEGKLDEKHRALNHQPSWAADRIVVIREFEKLLLLQVKEINKVKEQDIDDKFSLLKENIKRAENDPEFKKQLVKELLS